MRAAVVVSTVACLLAGGAAIAGPPSPVAAPPMVAAGAKLDMEPASRWAPPARPTSRAQLEGQIRVAAARRLRSNAGPTVVIIILGGPQVDAIPIADVTGDHRDDIAETHFSAARDNLVVRRGDSGKPVWTASQSGLLAVEYLPTVGSSGTLLTYSLDFTGEDVPVGFADLTTLTVSARDLKTGAVRWTSAHTGTELVTPFTYTVAALPMVDGVLTATAGLSPRVLLEQQSYSDSTPCEAQPLLIDATTGATAPATPVAGAISCNLVTVGDLDGDGVSDFITAGAGPRSLLVAASGAKGTPIWTRSDLVFDYAYAFGASDFSGDRRPDVVAEVESSASTPSLVIGINGADGSSLWSKAADYAVALGDIDGDHRMDFRMVTRPSLSSIRYEGTSGTGKTLWSTTLSAPRTNGFAYSESFSAGDVNSDGVNDIYVRWVGKRGDVALSDAQIDGRSGAAHTTADLGYPYLVSIDGRGADLIKDGSSRGHLLVSTFDGATDKHIWTSVLVTTATHLEDVYAGHFTASGRDQVVITASGKGGYTAVLDTRTGRLLWHATYDLGGFLLI